MARQPHASSRYRPVRIAALTLCLLQTLYAAAFIYRTSFIVEGRRYFCLFDDAMISMRYADNWARGHGLVWNPGERVEGYTNFAWTLLMGLVHLLPLSPGRLCLALQLIGIPVLWLNLVAVLHLARSVRLVPLAAVGAAALTGFFYSLVHFTLTGMETGLLAAIVTLAAADAISTLRTGRHALRASVWLTLAMLLRPDAAIFVVLIAPVLLIRAGRSRAAALAGVATLVFVVAVHVLWRHHYYGQWLPNTYYLKATGWPLADRFWPGFTQSARTAIWLSPVMVLALSSLLLRARLDRLLLATMFCVAVAYQWYVGGDAWPRDRMVIPAIPALFVLAADGTVRVARGLADGRLGRTCWIAACLTACFLIPNARYTREALFIIAPHGTLQNRENVRYLLAVERTLRPEGTLAVGFAGTVPYLTRRHCYDLFGKCDPYIARLPAHPEVARSGHNKFDLRYTVTQQRPDALIHGLATSLPEFTAAYLPALVTVDGHDCLICFRRQSPGRQGGRPISWMEAAVQLEELHRTVEGR